MDTQVLKKSRIGSLDLSIAVSYTIFLIIALVIYSMIVVLPSLYTTQETRVPDVTNFTQQEAKSALEDAGISNIEIRTIPDDEVADGEVIRTNPSAGTKIKSNADVSIYIAE